MKRCIACAKNDGRPKVLRVGTRRFGPFCRRCTKSIVRRCAENGTTCVPGGQTPSGSVLHDIVSGGVRLWGPSEPSVAQIRAALISESSMNCDQIVTWTARNKAEYDRAAELGIVAGWASFEAYEAHVSDVLGHLDVPVVMVKAMPDEIAAAMEKHGLPNTEEGRARLWVLMAKEAGQV